MDGRHGIDEDGHLTEIGGDGSMLYETKLVRRVLTVNEQDLKEMIRSLLSELDTDITEPIEL